MGIRRLSGLTVPCCCKLAVAEEAAGPTVPAPEEMVVAAVVQAAVLTALLETVPDLARSVPVVVLAREG